ncbi:hypothetical protein NKI51_11675 [Mesorhizobium australicum]|uniref:hypothetical protein n=1 Tax=Mesorhizobium australicum TaxID=536018 RepID=UPI00333D09FC
MVNGIEEVEVKDATEFLTALLASGRPIKLGKAMHEANRLGIRWRAVIYTRRAIGVLASRDKAGEWYWKMPETALAEAA